MHILTRHFSTNLCLSLAIGSVPLVVGVMSLDFTTAIKHVPVANDGQLVSLVQQAYRFQDPTPSVIEEQLSWRNEVIEQLCLCNAALFGGDELSHFELEIEKLWHHQVSREECCTKCRRAKN